MVQYNRGDAKMNISKGLMLIALFSMHYIVLKAEDGVERSMFTKKGSDLMPMHTTRSSGSGSSQNKFMWTNVKSSSPMQAQAPSGVRTVRIPAVNNYLEFEQKYNQNIYFERRRDGQQQSAASKFVRTDSRASNLLKIVQDDKNLIKNTVRLKQTSKRKKGT